MTKSLLSRFLLLPGQVLFSLTRIFSISVIIDSSVGAAIILIPVLSGIVLCFIGAKSQPLATAIVLIAVALSVLWWLLGGSGDHFIQIVIIISFLCFDLCRLLRGAFLGLTTLISVLAVVTALPFFLSIDNTSAALMAILSALWMSLLYSRRNYNNSQCAQKTRHSL